MEATSFSHIWNEWMTKPYIPINGKKWTFKIFACFLRFVAKKSDF